MPSAAPGSKRKFFLAEGRFQLGSADSKIMPFERDGAVYARLYHAPWGPRLASRAASA